jgi:ABC-type dipeptide/oligopeptide/nickel transport system permease component
MGHAPLPWLAIGIPAAGLARQVRALIGALGQDYIRTAGQKDFVVGSS